MDVEATKPIRVKALPSMARATLEHLTGPAPGTVTWVDEDALDVSTGNSHVLHVVPTQSKSSNENVTTRFRRAEDS